MTDTKPTPAAEKVAAAAEKAVEKAAEKVGGKKDGSNKVWMGTAVGVGSAALVAALMYAKRRK